MSFFPTSGGSTPSMPGPDPDDRDPAGGPSSHQPPPTDEPPWALDRRWLQPVPEARPAGRPSTGAIWGAMSVIAVLAGAALFVSGLTLGRQAALTPGTAEERQERFRPFWNAYDKIDAQYVGEFDRDALVEGALKGMFQALGDPYSNYMTAEEYKRSMQSISGQFGGVGATMALQRPGTGAQCDTIAPDCLLTVVEVLEDMPAHKAGIKAGDVILSLDGVALDGTGFEDAVKKVRGDPGTTIRLGVRSGSNPVREIELTRAVITTREVSSRVLANGTVGYIRLNKFSTQSGEDFRAELRKLLEERKLKKLVFDLRDDFGGFVSEAQEIASEFIASGPILYEETARGVRTPQEARPGGVATDPSVQLVVLVNGGTASASEIVAGALQDTGRGRLVGQKTYGKGLIQEWQLLSNGGGFSLSVKKWLTPKSRWIHGDGLHPDVPVQVPENVPAGRDPVLERALELFGGRPQEGAALLAAA
jgi:carboxyl-terminal processing protease